MKGGGGGGAGMCERALDEFVRHRDARNVGAAGVIRERFKQQRRGCVQFRETFGLESFVRRIQDAASE